MVSVREITPEAEYAIDKHANNLIQKLEQLIAQTDEKNELQRYKEAEEQGLLEWLPCKLGGDAYFVNEATEEVCEAVVTNIELNYYTPSRVWLDVSYVSKLIGKQSYYHCADKLIGKKLFFTREEAEKALEALEEV